MPAKLTRKCKHCYKNIPASRPRSKYCREACRVGYHRSRKRAQAVGKAKMVTPEHITKIKQLAFEQPDELVEMVRSVFTDSVRSEINDHVRDNLLGMTEVLVDMAPAAIEALQDDLKSEDDYVRSRAYALWFKYVMPLQQQSSKEEDGGGNVTVVLATPFSERVAAVHQGKEMEDAEVIDTSDWHECYACHQVKHPDNMHRHDIRHGGTERWICVSCEWKKKSTKGIESGDDGDDIA